MFSLTVLGSGSAGNCALVQTDQCRLLLDGGLSAKQIVTRLASLGLTPDALDGILLTHEHGDHARALDVLCRKWPEVPFFCTRLTADALRHQAGRDSALDRHAHWRFFAGGRDFEIKDLTVSTFPVPHDAAEPVGFVLHHQASASGDREGAAALGFLTDLGHATKLVVERVRTVTTLFIEANHDDALLAADPHRPWSVKQRITSRHGHLSNEAAGEVVGRILEAGRGRLRRAVLGHLSKDCNRPDLAVEAVRAGAGEHAAALECLCATQAEISATFVVEMPIHAMLAKVEPPAPVEQDPYQQLSLFAA